jgi:hypothetical protein
MKSISILFALALFAGIGSAQTDGSSANGNDSKVSASTRVSVSGNQPSSTNYHFHGRLFNACCGVDSGYGGDLSGGYSSAASGAAPAYQNTVVSEQGDPQWAPTRYVKFAKALRLGQQQIPAGPNAAPSADAVQQMLYQIQQEKMEAAAAAAQGAPAPAESAAPRTSSYVPYDQAVALGAQQQAAAQAAENPEPLGDVARDNQQQKAAESKAAVKIKQDADGNPVMVEKKPQ